MSLLRPLQLAASLARLFPHVTPPRRPVPVIWYDHVREPRAARHLRRLAVEWAGRAADQSDPPAGSRETTDARATVAAGAGWSGVVFSRTA